MKVNIIEATHDKFKELTELGIVLNFDEDKQLLSIDRDKLAQILGYTLVLSCDNATLPVFKKLTDIYYTVNETLYLSNVIPYESLTTYVMNDVKDSFSSF